MCFSDRKQLPFSSTISLKIHWNNPLWLFRYKVSGPDGSSYWATHDAHLLGSDADDV
jgi:hypothetical protein